VSDFKANMHQTSKIWLGFCPRPRWGSLQRSPYHLAGCNGPTSKRRGGEWRRWEGERREREKSVVESKKSLKWTLSAGFVIGRLGFRISAQRCTQPSVSPGSVNDYQPWTNVFYTVSRKKNWHATKCGVGRIWGRIWTVTNCGPLGTVFRLVINVGLRLGLLLRLG